MPVSVVYLKWWVGMVSIRLLYCHTYNSHTEYVSHQLNDKVPEEQYYTHQQSLWWKQSNWKNRTFSVFTLKICFKICFQIYRTSLRYSKTVWIYWTFCRVIPFAVTLRFTVFSMLSKLPQTNVLDLQTNIAELSNLVHHKEHKNYLLKDG